MHEAGQSYRTDTFPLPDAYPSALSTRSSVISPLIKMYSLLKLLSPTISYVAPSQYGPIVKSESHPSTHVVKFIPSVTKEFEFGTQLVTGENCNSGVPDAVARNRSMSAVASSRTSTFLLPAGRLIRT